MNVREHLQGCPLFADLSAETVDALAGHVRVLSLRGGEPLFDAGDAPDALYLIASGRIAVDLGPDKPRAEVGSGETVGEIGALSGEPRMAAAMAMRDSVLLQLDSDALLQHLQHHPQALLAFTRLIVQRLLHPPPTTPAASARSVRTIALVPLTADVDAPALARSLCNALHRFGNARCVAAADVGAPVPAGAMDQDLAMIERLGALEQGHRYLVYVADPDPGPWTRRCVRQADRILLLAPAAAPDPGNPVLQALRAMQPRAPVEVVISGRHGARPAEAVGWRDAAGAGFHYWVDDAASCQRLARQLTGRAIGLVLGGGGARGFAHIGLLRALEERGISIDLAGGTSMGAFISALHIAGLDARAIRDAAHQSFVARNYLNDYHWPRVSLIRGRRFLRQLGRLFGDGSIETLARPWYCVTTNISSGSAEIHDRGPLALWVGTSMCVPGVAPPLVYRGELLVDGGVVNCLPTDVMQALGRGPVLASNVSAEIDLRVPGVPGPSPDALLRYRRPGKGGPRLMHILYRTATLSGDDAIRSNADLADIALRMPVQDVGIFDWQRLDELVQRGYEHASRTLDRAAPAW